MILVLKYRFKETWKKLYSISRPYYFYLSGFINGAEGRCLAVFNTFYADLHIVTYYLWKRYQAMYQYGSIRYRLYSLFKLHAFSYENHEYKWF